MKEVVGGSSELFLIDTSLRDPRENWYILMPEVLEMVILFRAVTAQIWSPLSREAGIIVRITEHHTDITGRHVQTRVFT